MKVLPSPRVACCMLHVDAGVQCACWCWCWCWCWCAWFLLVLFCFLALALLAPDPDHTHNPRPRTTTTITATASYPYPNQMQVNKQGNLHRSTLYTVRCLHTSSLFWSLLFRFCCCCMCVCVIALALAPATTQDNKRMVYSDLFASTTASAADIAFSKPAFGCPTQEIF